MKDCSATADNVVVLPVPEFVSDTDSLVCLLGGVMLESGDRGLNPSHCTVECDWASHSYTLPLLPSSMIWYCSISWGVNRHTMRHAAPVSLVLQLWLVPG